MIIFEKVFIKVFFLTFMLKKKKKPSKVDYLISLLINFLRKMRQNFFRILFVIFFNWLLFFSLSLNSYFIYPALNLLIIFFIYEFYLKKKLTKKFFKNLKI